MKRPFFTWIVFFVCFALLLFAMAWVSVTVVKLNRADIASRRQAVLEENARLALWRMESEVAYLVARESVRPSYHYFAPSDAAGGDAPALTSLLPDEDTPFVRLFFQVDGKGNLTSPQIGGKDGGPIGKQAKPPGLLGELKRVISRETLDSVLCEGESGVAAETPEQSEAVARQDVQTLSPDDFPGRQTTGDETPVQQTARSATEFQMRNQFSQRAAIDNNPGNVNFSQQSEIINLLNSFPGKEGTVIPLPGEPGTAVMTPIWIEGSLFLLRRVGVDGSDLIQGCWLDWAAIRKWLTAEIADLLPNATLEPIGESAAAGYGDSHRLASLPIRLVPGDFDGYPVPGSRTMTFSLIIAWACVLLAAGSVALLLQGTLRLSERRGAFVSAVTHELRTPLTTMQMYTEMLADDMVPDEKKRRHYLKTIHAESDRLGHLVENVLAYARIEKSPPRGKVEALPIGDLVGRVKSRLDQRAHQAGMKLVIDAAGEKGALRVRADVSAVEQILFNLVDNACKYGADEDRTILVSTGVASGVAAGRGSIAVRDFGGGVGQEAEKRLFRPFSKSARDAADSAPGVGLGLSLSRRLARLMGGDLRLDKSVAEGARFVLTLPAA